MPQITLPDGSKKEFPSPVTVQQVAESIGAGLAKAAIAGKVNDKLVDTSHLIHEDSLLQIITNKDAEGLEIIRHSAAHLLAHAVKQLFPDAQVTIGPVIENGFYYDFAYKRPFTPDDLEKIENRMLELSKASYPVTHRKISRDEAIKLFEQMGEHYKVQIIKDIPEQEVLTVYQQDDFVDLCRGPHTPHTGWVKAFKLTKLAGAYWRGDSNNEMLQRIYGTAWTDKKALDDYLTQLEEAKKRDHREIGKKMDLFHFQPEAPGMVFWHANGWQMIGVMRNYLRDLLKEDDYQEVNTPQIIDSVLWKQSGHWEKFKDDIFALTSEEREFAIKPMSCPCHVQIFKQGLKSYRDLPIRLAEFGIVHRNEPSGTLHGLMRVRALVQDDGHVFCTEDQIPAELTKFIRQLHKVYKDFGFTEVIHKLSTRPEKRVGSDELWDKAEKALGDALDQCGVQWDTNPGEGAFYGPKIEFSLKDCLGRIWQCGTIQLDYFMAERLGAYYIAEDGNKKTPITLHRAILGSLERFLGILLEHYAGKMPLWLAPIQVVVLNITDNQRNYVQEVQQILQKNGIRANLDLRNEKIGFKIREHTIARIPYLVVLGDREVADKTITSRALDGEKSDVMSIDEFIQKLQREILAREK